MVLIRSLLALLLLTLVGGAVAQPTPGVTLIRGAHVFDGSGSAARVRDVLVRGGQIVRVARRIRPPADARVVEAKGMTLLPGLHDLHIHTRSQAFTTPAALTQQFAPYLAAGVTSINEYSVSGPMIAEIRALAAQPGSVTPRLNLAVRLGVPHGHGTESQFTNAITAQVTTPEEARAAMARLLPYRPDLVKVFADGWRYDDPGRTDRPSIDEPTLAAVVEVAHRAGVPVVTHTVTLAGAKIAAQAGVDALVHGIGDKPVDAELIRLMKRGGTAYVSTLVVYEPQQRRAQYPAEWAMLRAPDRAREERRNAEPVKPIEAWEAHRWKTLQDNLRALHRAGVRIGVGTDAGIGGVYHGWATIREMIWLSRLGMSPREVLHAATAGSARIIGRQDRQGRIAPGLAADLVLVGGRPDRDILDIYDVRRVWVGGRAVDIDAERRLRAEPVGEAPAETGH